VSNSASRDASLATTANEDITRLSFAAPHAGHASGARRREPITTCELIFAQPAHSYSYIGIEKINDNLAETDGQTFLRLASIDRGAIGATGGRCYHSAARVSFDSPKTQGEEL
jgi:hypothetical protein